MSQPPIFFSQSPNLLLRQGRFDQIQQDLIFLLCPRLRFDLFVSSVYHTDGMTGIGTNLFVPLAFPRAWSVIDGFTFLRTIVRLMSRRFLFDIHRACSYRRLRCLAGLEPN